MHSKPVLPAWFVRVNEFLDDDVVQAVMRRDGLTRQDVLVVMAEAASRINTNQAVALAAA